jgi:hypothetical protein
MKHEQTHHDANVQPASSMRRVYFRRSGFLFLSQRHGINFGRAERDYTGIAEQTIKGIS